VKWVKLTVEFVGIKVDLVRLMGNCGMGEVNCRVGRDKSGLGETNG
jgi:hypothetical protein